MTVTEVRRPLVAVTRTGSPARAFAPAGVTVTVTGRSSGLGVTLVTEVSEGALDEQAASGDSRAATTAARTRGWARTRVRDGRDRRDNRTSGRATRTTRAVSATRAGESVML
ncbi:hypothetical protein SMICM17S_01625 [Streptomyces microflavus]